MAYCKNCGNALQDGAKFCPKCGAQIMPAAPAGGGAGAQSGPAADLTPGTVPQNEGAGMPDAPSEKKRRKIWIPIVIIIAVVAVVLIALAATGVLSAKKTVRLNDYVSVAFGGYNGYGTAWVSFDTYGLGEDFNDRIKMSNEAELWGYDCFSDLVYDIVYVSVSPSGSLSNGDEVTVDWEVYLDYFDEMIKGNVELSYEPETFEVEDLGSLQSFDAFAGITVEFSGIAPEASASIVESAEYRDGAGEYLYFSLSPSDNLSIGDTVTVTISEGSADDLRSEMGIYPETLTKDYVVEDIPYYVSSLDQIPEDAMEKMRQQAEDEMASVYAGWGDDDQLLSMDYLGSYFLYEKPGVRKSDVNIIDLVYQVNARRVDQDNDGNDVTMDLSYYWYCGFYNGILLEDGTFTLDYSDYTASTDKFYRDGYDASTGTWTRTDYLYYYGFEVLDSMFNNIVTSRIDDYTYESTVQE